MRDLNENTLTAAVVDRFAQTPNPRLKRVVTSLVRHLHDFVRDVELTSDEWIAAIEFLTRTGSICSNVRQEFILLSDTLGISMLVDAINHPMPAGATETTVLGPFYVNNPRELPLGYDVSHGLKGEPLYVKGSVSTVRGERLPDAVVDIWHSDTDGFYDTQLPGLQDATYRGRFRTDAQGRFSFWSVMPRYYPIPDDGPVGEMLRATGRHPYRPAHVHFLIAAQGYETLITHIFSADSPYLDSDAVFGVKQSLIKEFTTEPPGQAPDGHQLQVPWRLLSQDFAVKQAAEHGDR